MDSAKLNDYVQIVGIAALVASLVFVGLQLKQAQEVAIAGQYQDRYATATEFWIAREQSDVQVRSTGQSAMRRWGLPIGFDEEITPDEFGSRYLFARIVLAQFDNHHFQYLAGYSTDEIWAVHQTQLRDIVALPLYQYVFENNRDKYRTSYGVLYDTLKAETGAALE